MAYSPTEWKDGDLITAELMNKLEQGVANEQVGPAGPQGEPGAGLTGSAAKITKLAGTEDAAQIAAKVNEMIDVLIARGISAAAE